jgi:hypothetical protein
MLTVQRATVRFVRYARVIHQGSAFYWLWIRGFDEKMQPVYGQLEEPCQYLSRRIDEDREWKRVRNIKALQLY